MRVLLVHNYYRSRGGEGAVVEKTMRVLRRHGASVSLLSRDSAEIGDSAWSKAGAFASSLWSIPAARDMARRLRETRPDVVHVHNVYPLISPSVLVACRRAGVPVVMTCHNYRLVCPTSNHVRAGRVCELCCGGREYWCVLKNCRDDLVESVSYAARGAFARTFHLFRDNVTMFIALTAFAKERLAAAGLDPERIRVVPNMVGTEDARPSEAEGEYGAFAGRMSSEKGLGALLDAAARRPELRIRLAGDGPLEAELRRSAGTNVAFLGRLDADGMRAFYRGARFVVLPSECFEMFPLVVLEAMSHGLPVVASRIGGLPEIVDDGVTGVLFRPGDAADLGREMGDLWADPARCRRLGAAGREKARREYGEDAGYRRLVEVYEEARERVRPRG